MGLRLFYASRRHLLSPKYYGQPTDPLCDVTSGLIVQCDGYMTSSSIHSYAYCGLRNVREEYGKSSSHSVQLW